MGLFFSIVAFLVIAVIGYLGNFAPTVFGVVIPYIALGLFLIGIVVRIIKWATSPVPFRITTTAGQQKSLPWIHRNRFDNPSNAWETFVRMLLEVLFFRSLFRNTRASIKDGKKLVYGAEKWLWLFAILFHWSFLIIVLRHFRFFTEPTPAFVGFLQNIDGFFQFGVPILYITNVAIVVALTYLFLRRVIDQKIKYISLSSDYFPLLLILGIATTGILMRYFFKVDLVQIKELAVGILSFNPVIPNQLNPIFSMHLFFVSVLLIYFPMSKLVHMPGIFFSPTRNLSNDNREKRHINPWNKEFKMHYHTYEEYEDEFREVMKNVNLPLEKEEK
ncbi:MAG: sulfate reduction electron transfer complex DsrMKJOP subunit DsrM [Candidatus Kapabacteria bacterium]|nr:sulfate reduction electron transfer complex DsrMKJOP subunit DsrM [Candidatus Kapabacteria bacterium]